MKPIMFRFASVTIITNNRQWQTNTENNFTFYYFILLKIWIEIKTIRIRENVRRPCNWLFVYSLFKSKMENKHRLFTIDAYTRLLSMVQGKQFIWRINKIKPITTKKKKQISKYHSPRFIPNGPRTAVSSNKQYLRPCIESQNSKIQSIISIKPLPANVFRHGLQKCYVNWYRLNIFFVQ